VFAVEAENIRQVVEKLPGDKRTRVERQAREVIEREADGDAVACPLLVDDVCSIYESRPLICRTQGLPLLIEADDGRPEIDYCPLNFTDDGARDDLDEDHLVPLDELNLRLAMVNLHYCRDRGIGDAQSGERVKIADIVLESQVAKRK
jgi:Fe-S-cluster containining protein